MHVGVLRGGGYFCNIPLGDYQFTIPLAFKTVTNLAGFIQYSQPGKTKENKPCEKWGALADRHYDSDKLLSHICIFNNKTCIFNDKKREGLLALHVRFSSKLQTALINAITW